MDRNMFFHVLKPLEERHQAELQKDDPDKSLLQDMEATFEFHAEEYKPEIESLTTLLEEGEISYELLWAILQPGSILVDPNTRSLEPQLLVFEGAHVVKGHVNPYTRSEDRPHWLVRARHINHNGEQLGWGQRTFKIYEFPGSKEITSLDVFPLDFHSDPDGVRQRAIERGKAYFSLLEPSCRQYNGFGTHTVYEGSKWVEKNFNASGRIMVDPIAFRRKDFDSILAQPTPKKGFDLEAVGDLERMCANHRVLGYSLQQKRWGAFAVSGISDVVWNKEAFDRVIMPERKHKLVRSLVMSHLSQDKQFDDIISGKGKGLVGLLSGGPGVGKSLTAEAVAELCARPLFTVTSADLGRNTAEVHQNLDMILEFTRRWGCVLLIDEADVFLQKRDKNRLDVNALVSVFLHHLESVTSPTLPAPAYC
jgi:hypothetical protein